MKEHKLIDLALIISIIGAYLYFAGHIYQGAYYGYFELPVGPLQASVASEKQITVGTGIIIFLLIEYWYISLPVAALTIFCIKTLLNSDTLKPSVKGLCLTLPVLSLCGVIVGVGVYGEDKADELASQHSGFVDVLFQPKDLVQEQNLKLIGCYQSFCGFYSLDSGETFSINTNNILSMKAREY
ncbi:MULTISPECIES: hypothetical protein [Vibrio]|uniref:hypothetical protein n=1 Tax=Vibrio TaxID=662 RepID=UPI000576F0A0|nr:MULTISPECIES: hypothetical protein [Vibrio]ELP1878804.1 hypothetical protein [Vibrio vulnificus]